MSVSFVLLPDELLFDAIATAAPPIAAAPSMPIATISPVERPAAASKLGLAVALSVASNSLGVDEESVASLTTLALCA